MRPWDQDRLTVGDFNELAAYVDEYLKAKREV